MAELDQVTLAAGDKSVTLPVHTPTLGSKETTKWEDGNEYPLVKVEISSASHPFYTGQNKVMDVSGRIDKFKKRYAK